MAFCPHHLRIVACHGGFTLWHYRTDDSREQWLEENYFAAATASLRKGDVLIIEQDGGNHTADHTDSDNLNISLYALTDKKPPSDDRKPTLS